MQRRFTSSLETVLDQHPGTSGPIMIVSHAGLYWANLPFLFKNIEFEFMRERGLDNATLIVENILVVNGDVLAGAVSHWISIFHPQKTNNNREP